LIALGGDGLAQADQFAQVATSRSACERISGTTERAALPCEATAVRPPAAPARAGGARRPARCRAASTSTISERREIQRGTNLLLARIERTQPGFGVADPVFDSAHAGRDIDQLLIELAAVLADRRDIGLYFSCNSAALFCCARAASSSCSRCLIASGEGAVAC